MMLFGLLFGTLLEMLSSFINTHSGVGIESWHLMVLFVLCGCLCVVYKLYSLKRDYDPNHKEHIDPLVRFSMTHPTDLPFV